MALRCEQSSYWKRRLSIRIEPEPEVVFVLM
jgi:hypothetical protein